MVDIDTCEKLTQPVILRSNTTYPFNGGLTLAFDTFAYLGGGAVGARPRDDEAKSRPDG
jgi:hypothetical protein